MPSLPTPSRKGNRTAALKADAQAITDSLIDRDAMTLEAVSRCQPE